MKKIAIIGGGFSGTMLALQLCSQDKACEIHIIEPRELLGLGVAYSTDEPGHLLNVAATNMSAWPDKPHDFVGFLVDTHASLAHVPVGYFNTYFASRMTYGNYIQSLVTRPEYSSIIHHREQALRIQRVDKNLVINLSNNQNIHADHIIIAAGIPPSGAMDRIFGWAPEGRYLAHPWDNNLTKEFLTNIDPNDAILIIGAGLTMIDMLISLEQHKIRGPIAVVSRHGLAPQVHEDFERIELCVGEMSPREWLKIFRSHKDSWRSVYDFIRPKSQAIWQNFGVKHKNQFLRHLRHLWDSHRHRVAPEVHRFLSRGMAQNRINLYAGRMLKTETSSKGFRVDFQGRDQLFSLSAHRVINCTGPESQVINFKGSLFAGLLKDGLVTPDPTGLGLNTRNFQAIPQNGYQDNNLYILGALRRGTHWETTAVPELRLDAYKLAQVIISNI